MPNIPNANRELDQKFGLAKHRTYAQRISGIISGQWAQSVEEYDTTKVIYVYRTPTADDLRRQPDLAETQYATLSYNQEGQVFAEGENGARHMLACVTADPDEALAYIGQLFQNVQNRKIELKLIANELIEKKRRRDSVPDAVLQMVSIYEDLLKQLEHEHYRQRDRSQEQKMHRPS